MKQRRISNSPLMDPSVCAVVLIAPDARGLASTVVASRPDLQRTLSAIMKAAGIADVPVFILSRDAQQQAVSLPRDIGIASARGQFVVLEHGSPWSHQGFVDALAAADRSILILAGFWLEHEILSTALHALVESYDVYVLLDATPPRSRLGSEPSRDRLNQAGATLVISSQVIHEWSLETADASERAALLSLLPDLVETE
jgi:nicotinamidase-related amidase